MSMGKIKYTLKQLKEMENIPHLTERERFVFKMYFQNNIRIEDIAQELHVGLRKGNAEAEGMHRSTVNRAIRSIRDKYEEYKAYVYDEHTMVAEEQQKYNSGQ